MLFHQIVPSPCTTLCLPYSEKDTLQLSKKRNMKIYEIFSQFCRFRIGEKHVMKSLTDTDWTTLIQQHRPTTALTESICDGGTFTLEAETGNGNNGKYNGFLLF